MSRTAVFGSGLSSRVSLRNWLRGGRMSVRIGLTCIKILMTWLSSTLKNVNDFFF